MINSLKNKICFDTAKKGALASSKIWYFTWTLHISARKKTAAVLNFCISAGEVS